MADETPAHTPAPTAMDRREFCARAGAGAVALTVLGPGAVRGSAANSAVRLGVIGCGQRGTWIAALFNRHGGYEIAAAADYFPGQVETFGAKFGVARERRFAGLGGYRRLLESGVDAVAIESPPYFHPEQAEAAVTAGVHVYLAKPVAVDVPGCQSIAAVARRAAERGRVFLVDFQTRAHPIFLEALSRVRGGAIGEIVFAEGTYHGDCPWEKWYDLLREAPSVRENWIRGWGLDRALSGDSITEQYIHTLDVMHWAMGRPPVSATGSCGLKARPRIGDCADHFVVLFEYPDGVRVTFSGRQFKGHGTAEGIRNRVFGTRGVLETQYAGDVLIRGEQFWRGGRTGGIYEEGAVANIATFHDAIARGDVSNTTVTPSVESTLVSILGRNAAYGGRVVTWTELLADRQRLEANLEGLRA